MTRTVIHLPVIGVYCTQSEIRRRRLRTTKFRQLKFKQIFEHTQPLRNNRLHDYKRRISTADLYNI